MTDSPKNKKLPIMVLLFTRRTRNYSDQNRRLVRTGSREERMPVNVVIAAAMCSLPLNICMYVYKTGVLVMELVNNSVLFDILKSKSTFGVSVNQREDSGSYCSPLLCIGRVWLLNSRCVFKIVLSH